MNDSLKCGVQKLQRRLLDGVVRKMAAPSLERRAQYFSGIFEPWLPRNSDILDIGGGWGFYHEPLVSRGHRHTVLDVVRPGFQKVPVVVYDGTRIPFPEKSFDVSMLVTVLHHAPETLTLIEEASRVTRTCVVVIEDLYHHAVGRWWTSLRDMLYNFEFIGHAARFHTKKEWGEIFSRRGLTMTHSKEMFTRLAGMRILNGVMLFAVGS